MLTLDDQSFETEVLQSEQPVVVDFTATWCGPCRRLAPIIEELAQEYEGRVKIAKFDVDASPETPARYRIMAVPTIMFFKGGKEVDTVQGLVPKETLKKKIEGLLG
ncbi:MAG: thioredoxin [Planctomycetota bacterium]|nr:MAG: thioredoxin [Planctomycetota bacterium]